MKKILNQWMIVKRGKMIENKKKEGLKVIKRSNCKS